MLILINKENKNMKKMKKNGFTLVEIMIVVLIIGLLAAIAIPGFARARKDARAKSCVNNQRLLADACEQERMKGNDNVTAATVNTEYFKGNVLPTCPEGGTYTYNATSALVTCSNNEHNQ